MATLPVLIESFELQIKFNCNEGGYPARIGLLRQVKTYDEPARSASGQKASTRSVIFKDYDGPNVAMVLHCFIEPSGRLGASGKLDPKRLLVLRVHYYCA